MYDNKYLVLIREGTALAQFKTKNNNERKN